MVPILAIPQIPLGGILTILMLLGMGGTMYKPLMEWLRGKGGSEDDGFFGASDERLGELTKMLQNKGAMIPGQSNKFMDMLLQQKEETAERMTLDPGLEQNLFRMRQWDNLLNWLRPAELEPLRKIAAKTDNVKAQQLANKLQEAEALMWGGSPAEDVDPFLLQGGSPLSEDEDMYLPPLTPRH